MQALGKSRQKNSTIPLESFKERYGNAENLLKVYLDICKCLSGRCGETDWENYTSADWEFFEKVVLREGVAALINSKKPELKPLLQHIPIDIWLEFSAFRMRVKHTNELRYKELDQNVFPSILPDFKPVVMLKGSALALSLYEDISLRNMCDTDLLIDEKYLNDAAERFKGIGYEIFIESITHLKPISSALNEDKHLSFKKKGSNGMLLELHWKIIRQYQQRGFDLDSWFEKNLMQVCDDGKFHNTQGLFMLNPTACIVHQILHIYFCHSVAVSALFHFYETYFMAKKWQGLIECYEVSAIFEKLGLSDVLILASTLIEELFGETLPFPNSVAEGNNAFILKLKAQPMKTTTAQNLYIMKGLSFRQRISFALETVFPPPSYMKERYRNEKSENLLYLYLKRLSDGFSDLPKIIRALLG